MKDNPISALWVLLTGIVTQLTRIADALEAKAGDAPEPTEVEADEVVAEEEPEAEPEPVVEKPKGKKGGKPAPAPEPEPEAEAETEEEPAEEEAETVTVETLRELAKKALTKGKNVEVKGLLTKFKSESITLLNKKHYEPFHAALKKLVA